MIGMGANGITVFCDETAPSECRKSIAVNAEPGTFWTVPAAIVAARNSGWRVYVQRTRRDLCPPHRVAALDRLSLVAAS